MGVSIRKPTERRCEACGRREVWNDTTCTWRVAVENDERVTGEVYCIHEWDINGSFVPLEKDVASA